MRRTFNNLARQAAGYIVARSMTGGQPGRPQHLGGAQLRQLLLCRSIGRGDRIRTCDFQFPKLALYQAELRPGDESTLANRVAQRHRLIWCRPLATTLGWRAVSSLASCASTKCSCGRSCRAPAATTRRAPSTPSRRSCYTEPRAARGSRSSACAAATRSRSWAAAAGSTPCPEALCPTRQSSARVAKPC